MMILPLYGREVACDSVKKINFQLVMMVDSVFEAMGWESDVGAVINQKYLAIRIAISLDIK
ncbi:hypothetical protein [Bartonella sp. WD12.1]|uniref:hypothetical protein n=1 Tax=Bartonella sp. WD12.1 TaxID=1933903 RepID=UPI0009C78623|nr:hypothetical protein [Bartonella sp. WD12.1]OPB29316.1 hypothetical protein BWD121_003280 [Bartonella sp. WD12.1]